ncbi:MAG: trypsin-like serine peptidase [Thermoanaerobaculia bacterium]
MPAVLWMALFAGVEASAQPQAHPSEIGTIELEDGRSVIEVDGAPGPAPRSLQRAALRDLAYAAPRLTSSEIHTLAPLSESERATLRTKLVAGDRLQVGIARAFVVPVGFDLSSRKVLPQPGDRLGGGLFEQKSGRLVWTAGFVSPGAGAVRVRLERISLPVGTVAYAYNRLGEVHGPYAIGGYRPDPIWSNTLFSSDAFVEIEFPRGFVDISTARLNINVLAHIEHESFAPTPAARVSPEILASCFKDVNCVGESDLSGLSDARHAVAQMLFERDGSMYLCSGALVNSTAGSAIPYFLTANHCVGSAASARSLELFWDYRTTSCGGPAPSRSGFQRTLGSTLLATGSVEEGESDFTLLQLSQEPPAGRFHLGWSSAPVNVSGGTTIFRVAHPDGGPQMFSKHSISAVPTPGECSSLPQSRFVYSKNEIGATKGGSSGSPSFLEDGLKIVGQLFGRCGNNIPDQCDADQNSAVDGAFASYFAKVEPWLAPATATPCVSGTGSLCLLDGRFKVELAARDQRTGKTGAGLAIPEGDLFGYFSLPELTGQAENPEVFVKVLDARALSGKFWVFYGGLTDLEFTLTVTDSVTGAMKSYSKEGGSYCGNADTQAF